MHRKLPVTTLAVLLGSLAALVAQPPAAPDPAVPSEPPAPGSDVTLVLQDGQRPQLRLAFPSFTPKTALSPAVAAAHRTLEETLREDLERSGIFELQGPEELAVLELSGDLSTDFDLYRSLGNEAVLLGDVREEGGRLVLEGRVYDLASKQAILGKRYKAGVELARRMAHTFADEIVLYFTGRRGLALTALSFYSDRDGNKEIYLMDYDGRNVRPLTDHDSISMAPEWSPAGDALVYVSFFRGSPGIYRVDLNTGDKVPVITEGSFNSSPTFSPDGSRIAFSRSVDGNAEIFVMDRDGTNLRRLTHSPGIDTNPAWSPNGSQIAFTSSRAGNPHVYVMDAEGTNLRRITFSGAYNDGAAWSPDGTKVAYATRRRGQLFDIATTDLALLETQILTDGPGSHEAPSYSPDGRRIAFASTVGGRTQIRVMDADGGRQELLTADGNNWAPDWSPYLEAR